MGPELFRKWNDSCQEVKRAKRRIRRKNYKYGEAVRGRGKRERD